jgi:hypothetical protein
MPIAATKVLIGSLAKDLGRLSDVGDGFSPARHGENSAARGAEPRLTGVVQLGSTPLTLPRAVFEL